MSQFVKCRVDAVEIYPVWQLTLELELPEDWFDKPGKPADGKPPLGYFEDIPVTLVERYKSAQKEWKAVQGILSDRNPT